MKNNSGVASTIIFVIGSIFYMAVLFGNDNYLLAGVILSLIGFILALFAEKGLYKKIGLIGNGVIIFIAVIFPFIVTTFFWNKP